MHLTVVITIRKETAYDFKNREDAEFEVQASTPVLMATDWGAACDRLIQDTIKKASRTFKRMELEEVQEAKAAAEAEAAQELADMEALAAAQEESAVPDRPPDMTGP